MSNAIANLKKIACTMYAIGAAGLYAVGVHVKPQLEADGLDNWDKLNLAAMSLPLMVPMAVLFLYGLVVVTRNPNPESGHTGYHSGESV
jgi:hypothetical protein